MQSLAAGPSMSENHAPSLVFQSKADVEFIRRVLDEAGGHQTKIISKIENLAGWLRAHYHCFEVLITSEVRGYVAISYTAGDSRWFVDRCHCRHRAGDMLHKLTEPCSNGPSVTLVTLPHQPGCVALPLLSLRLYAGAA